LLHGVFGVFALAADLHAEGKNGILQQGQGLLQGLFVAPLHQRNRLLDFGSHLGKCSMRGVAMLKRSDVVSGKASVMYLAHR
jgi:hypothetical protein